MIILKEEINRNSPLYASFHKKREFFDKEDKSEIEFELEQYIAGGYDFETKMDNLLKEYVRKSPLTHFELYRVQQGPDPVKNGKLKFEHLTSFTKSESWWKHVLNGEEDVPLDPSCAFILLKGAHSINIEGYGYFYEQRESLVYGTFEVVDTAETAGPAGMIPLYRIKQIGF